MTAGRRGVRASDFVPLNGTDAYFRGGSDNHQLGTIGASNLGMNAFLMPHDMRNPKPVVDDVVFVLIWVVFPAHVLEILA